MSFSAQGTLLATANTGGVVKVWADSEPLEPQGEREWNCVLEFDAAQSDHEVLDTVLFASADGDLLVTGSEANNVLRLWCVSSKSHVTCEQELRFATDERSTSTAPGTRKDLLLDTSQQCFFITDHCRTSFYVLYRSPSTRRRFDAVSKFRSSEPIISASLMRIEDPRAPNELHLQLCCVLPQAIQLYRVPYSVCVPSLELLAAQGLDNEIQAEEAEEADEHHEIDDNDDDDDDDDDGDNDNEGEDADEDPNDNEGDNDQVQAQEPGDVDGGNDDDGDAVVVAQRHQQLQDEVAQDRNESEPPQQRAHELQETLNDQQQQQQQQAAPDERDSIFVSTPDATELSNAVAAVAGHVDHGAVEQQHEPVPPSWQAAQPDRRDGTDARHAWLAALSEPSAATPNVSSAPTVEEHGGGIDAGVEPVVAVAPSQAGDDTFDGANAETADDEVQEELTPESAADREAAPAPAATQPPSSVPADDAGHRTPPEVLLSPQAFRAAESSTAPQPETTSSSAKSKREPKAANSKQPKQPKQAKIDTAVALADELKKATAAPTPTQQQRDSAKANKGGRSKASKKLTEAPDASGAAVSAPTTPSVSRDASSVSSGR